jgi:hypothetical protein
VALAPAVTGQAGKLAAPRRFPRLAARDGGAVEQAQVVAERRAADGQVGDDAGDRRGQRAQALVVAGLLGQIGKQVGQSPARERQELAVVGDRQEHLRDRQGDELGVADPGRMARTAALGQEIVHPHVKCGDESVEVGVHEASVVDVAIGNASFGALVMSPRASSPRPNTESTI